MSWNCFGQWRNLCFLVLLQESLAVSLLVPLVARKLVSGPAAGLAAIVLSAITSLGGFENFLVAVVLGGIIQLIFGMSVQGSLVTTSFPRSSKECSLGLDSSLS